MKPRRLAAPDNSGSLDDVERRHIESVLNQTNWMIEGERGAAKILDLNPSTLRSRMQKLGIKRPGPNFSLIRASGSSTVRSRNGEQSENATPRDLKVGQRRHTVRVRERHIGQIQFQCAAFAQKRFTSLSQLGDPRADDAAFEFKCDRMIGLSGLRNFQHKEYDLII